MRHNILAFAAASAITSSIGSAQAYTLWQTGDGDTIRFSSAPTFNYRPSVTDTQRSRITAAKNLWQNSPMSFSASMRVDDDNDVSINNNENEIWFSTSDAILGGAPAVTKVRLGADGAILAADVVFEQDVTWTTSRSVTTVRGYVSGGARSLEATAAHEFGHVFSLWEENDQPSIMGEDWNHVAVAGSTTYPDLGADAVAGVVSVYGEDSGIVDLGVLHWRWLRADGNYSEHAFVRAYRENGTTLLSSTPDATMTNIPVYETRAGSTIWLEFMFENLGSDCEMIPYTWYLSSSRDFSNPTVIREGDEWRACPGNTYLFSTIVTLPAGVTGRKYVGPSIENGESSPYSNNNKAWIALNILP
jgi:hypothetical protein